MKTIGLIGGMSWESTAEYYKIINTIINKQLGGLHSAKCLIYSMDFQNLVDAQSEGNWVQCTDITVDAAKSLERGGADFLVICSNTGNIVADDVSRKVSIPLLNIADVTINELLKAGIKRVGLIGTRFIMESDYYKSRFADKAIELIAPCMEDRLIVDRTIYNELCLGIISPESKNAFLSILQKLFLSGAEAVILGCTEICLLINQMDTNIKLFNTTEIHAKYAAMLATDHIQDTSY